MPLTIPAGIKIETIMELLTLDKKAVGRWPRFVLLERLGSVFCKDGQWAQEVSRDVVQRCVEQLSQKTP
jgi:3-dehydroquinate synthetase